MKIKLKYEQAILFRAILAGLAGTALSSYFVLGSDLNGGAKVSLMLLLIACWLSFAFSLKAKAVFPLRTMANLLEGIRVGDFSMRMRGSGGEDAMGELIWEVNKLSELLKQQRLNAVEATVLLRKVMAEIDVAMFGFDKDQRLQLINESGIRLLGLSEEELQGRDAKQLHLTDCLEGSTPRMVDLTFPAGMGRWQLRRNSYREGGLSHQLVFLTDLTHTLHEEERQAWKRVVRILRHEINNSLTPIQSVAYSLQKLFKQRNDIEDWEEDLQGGLEIIAERSEALDRFIEAYSKLTQLPKPRLGMVDVESWVRQAALLETRMKVSVEAGPEVVIQADRDQLGQLLINLVSNAVEASLEARREGEGQVHINWIKDDHQIQVRVDDDGRGLDEDKNVFVPFYTTKPQGSGIGLALSRQIAELHGGSVNLENHPYQVGCRASVILPLKPTIESQEVAPKRNNGLICVSRMFNIGRAGTKIEHPSIKTRSRKAS